MRGGCLIVQLSISNGLKRLPLIVGEQQIQAFQIFLFPKKVVRSMSAVFVLQAPCCLSPPFHGMFVTVSYETAKTTI